MPKALGALRHNHIKQLVGAGGPHEDAKWVPFSDTLWVGSAAGAVVLGAGGGHCQEENFFGVSLRSSDLEQVADS